MQGYKDVTGGKGENVREKAELGSKVTAESKARSCEDGLRSGD